MGTAGASVRRTDELSATALDVSDEQVVVGEGVALDVRPAGLLLRAASSALDAVVYALATGLAIWVFAWALTSAEQAGARLEIAAVVAGLIATMISMLVLVPCLVETLTRGKSVGRLVMRLRIVRDDGGAAGFRHAFVRALVGFFEIWSTSGGLALLVGLMHPRSKRLGDVLAGTYAQNEAAPALQPNLGPLPFGLESWAANADVARIPDRQARRMRDYLVQAPKLEPAARLRLAGTVAREVRAYVHPIPDVDADTFLRAVAAVRRDREWAALQLRAQRLGRVAPVLDRLPHGFPQRG